LIRRSSCCSRCSVRSRLSSPPMTSSSRGEHVPRRPRRPPAHGAGQGHPGPVDRRAHPRVDPTDPRRRRRPPPDHVRREEAGRRLHVARRRRGQVAVGSADRELLARLALVHLPHRGRQGNGADLHRRGAGLPGEGGEAQRFRGGLLLQGRRLHPVQCDQAARHRQARRPARPCSPASSRKPSAADPTDPSESGVRQVCPGERRFRPVPGAAQPVLRSPAAMPFTVCSSARFRPPSASATLRRCASSSTCR
jgi:hypothetical protein